MKYIYLAGAISGLSFAGATDWRAYVAERLREGVVPLSPMREKDFLRHEDHIQARYQEQLFGAAATYTARDELDVRRSDLLFAYLSHASKASVGTILEIGIARGLHKPIIAVMGPDSIHNHPMIREFSTLIYEDLDEAIDVTNWMLGEGV